MLLLGRKARLQYILLLLLVVPSSHYMVPGTTGTCLIPDISSTIYRIQIFEALPQVSEQLSASLAMKPADLTAFRGLLFHLASRSELIGALYHSNTTTAERRSRGHYTELCGQYYVTSQKHFTVPRIKQGGEGADLYRLLCSIYIGLCVEVYGMDRVRFPPLPRLGGFRS